jgi:pimeloyl-ACP methyl ester carboxylesterase
LALLAAILAAACSSGGGGGGPGPEATAAYDRDPCWFEEPDDTSVECGYLTVPADREDPGSEEIELAVAVFEARNADPAPDPIVYLDGGPGGRTLELINESFDALVDPYLDERDFVVFDQRGVGYSRPNMTCPEIQELGRYGLEEGYSEDEYTRAVAAAVDSCRLRLRDEGTPSGLANSAESAADLEDLRRALGYEKWNLYGISYGTRLALTAIRDFPGGIRSAVLDSVYPPEVDFVATGPADYARALDVLFRDCAADAACVAAYPDLEGKLYRTVERLDAERPVVPLPEGIAYFFEEVTLTGEVLLSAVFSALYVKELLPQLPALIQEVNDGDYERMALVAASLELSFEYLDYGMYLSVQCTEEVPFSSRDEALTTLAANPEIASAFYGEPDVSFDACAAFGVEVAPAGENEPVSGDVPILVVGGSYDPITPPGWGQEVAGRFTTAHAFEFPGDGHAVTTSNGCAEEIVLSFLASPEDDPESDCLEEEGPPEFE